MCLARKATSVAAVVLVAGGAMLGAGGCTLADRNTPQKLVWRSRIVLLSAAGNGTMSIMRAVGKSKPSVWRWQGRG